MTTTEKTTMETRLYVKNNGKWQIRETFTAEPGGREFAIERAAIWRAHGWQTKLEPCVTCGGKGFLNPDGSLNNAFIGSDKDLVVRCHACKEGVR
jgi:hypothetical protein